MVVVTMMLHPQIGAVAMVGLAAAGRVHRQALVEQRQVGRVVMAELVDKTQVAAAVVPVKLGLMQPVPTAAMVEMD